MSARDRFKNANTNFGVDRLKALPAITQEKQDEKGTTQEVYAADANYRVKVLSCKWISPRKGDDMFIAEVEILKSNNPKAPVGAKFAYKENMGRDAANARLVDFMFAALGVDRRDAKQLAEIKKLEADGKIPDMLAESLDDSSDPACKNALKDCVLDVEVTQRISKEKGQPYRFYSFFAVKS